jgi:hypothetical protein
MFSVNNLRMKLLSVFLVFIGLGASAQTKFDYLSCQKVLTEKIHDIQVKIWNGVIEGTLTPYHTVSLDSVISKTEIRERCAGIDSLEAERESFRCGTGTGLKSAQRTIDTAKSEGWDDFEFGSWLGEDSIASSHTWDSDSITSDDVWDSDSWVNSPIDSAIQAREDSAQEQENQKYNLKDDYVIRFDFDSTRDLTGLNFGFKNKVDLLTASINYEFSSVGVLSDLFLSSGINFGSSPVFWVSKNELSKVLSPEELVFLNALVLQRSSLGDFTPSWIEFDRAQGIEDWSYAMNHQRFTKYRILELEQRDLAVVSLYNSSVFYEILNAFTTKNSKWSYDGVLFKDSLLKKPWEYLLSELYSEYGLEMLSDSSDSYNYVFKMFRGISYPIFTVDGAIQNIKRNGENDYLVSVANKVNRVKNFTNKEYDMWIEIYFKYSSIKHLIQPYDRYILEALLQEITK